MLIKNKLLNYKDLSIWQEKNMFNFCIDSVIIARFLKINNKVKNIVDIGTNNAVIPLILSRYTKANIYGVEIQKKASEIAIKNVYLNNLQSQISIINEDISHYIKDKNNKFDLVYCNPPFFKLNDESKLNEISELTIARHEKKLDLENMLYCSKVLLNNNGRLVFVHVADRFEEIIVSLNKAGFSIKRIQFVSSKKKNTDCKKILIEAKLSKNKGCKILQPLYIHNDDGSYTQETLELFKD
ncbi:methyltransferase [Spiroplasma litorale]|uniref:Methyltransferase n=1 Tax=Spiroplasma litorale TaxID=216942 RepID=A0A0K1W0H0_9MOLU|nr:methyltransferase [Spiroplasma litorale]AKX33678.1 methyltransferase [Spiroplasma litorale]